MTETGQTESLFTRRAPARGPSTEVIDTLLTHQLAVAWAGELGDPRRLGWWKSELASEFGGEDLFRQLMPHTWRWAVLEAVREAARRHEADLLTQAADPDQVVTLFRLGFDVDERIEERLAALKRSRQPPLEALPGIAAVLSAPFTKATFSEWIRAHGDVESTAVPIGRRLKGELPEDLSQAANHLVAGLHPLGDAYPMPHYRRSS